MIRIMRATPTISRVELAELCGIQLAGIKYHLRILKDEMGGGLSLQILQRLSRNSAHSPAVCGQDGQGDEVSGRLPRGSVA